MDIYFCDCGGVPNFGDQLNLWLWPRVIPELQNTHTNGIFLGIGTILTNDIPVSPRYFICGSGTWGHTPRLRLTDRHAVYFVRGPLTADRLGLDRTIGITDPAALLRAVYSADQTRRSGIALMPHYATEQAGLWSAVAEDLGFRYIDATAPCSVVLQQISQSELLITDAMHGAIAADALRVPWIPFEAYRRKRQFKWHDWCESLGMTFDPIVLPRLWRPKGAKGLLAGMRWRIKKLYIVKALRRLVKQGTSTLSSIHTLENKIDDILSKLDDVKAAISKS